MVLKFFISYPYVVYSIISWGYIFIFIRIKGIKRLWPISILSALLIFGATYWLVSVGLYKINIDFLPVFGIPFFFILWGAGNGIIYANYFGEKTYQRILAILGFSAVATVFEYILEHYKKIEHIGKYNEVHEFIFDAFILSTLAFLMMTLFKGRIGKEN